MLVIYTDGSCKRHKSGWAFVDITKSNAIKIHSGTEHGSTSNRAEIIAIIEALKYARGRECMIFSDSMLAVNGANQWIWELEKTGWKTLRGNEVANKDLWQELLEVLLDSRATIKWIKGKDPNSIHYEFNKLADFEAKRAAK